MRASLNTLVGIDIGSTTVKVCLLTRDAGRWRLSATASAPTTVERPFEDVMVGIRDATRRLEEKSGRRLLKDGRPILEADERQGADVFMATSSAGGGCQMMVMGVMKDMTTESAHRAALGGGALVLDSIAIDDGRTVAERIQLLRELMPDAIMVSGGTDGGNVSHVVALAELIRAASPSPRFGENEKTPIIYAGNVDARGEFLEVLGEGFDIRFVDNIRPAMEREVTGPAREEIARVFLEHVVHQAPGYPEVNRWTDGFIRPTPSSIGNLLEKWGVRKNLNILAIDVGGATTDMFSVMDGVYNRTVSAGTGVGYAMGWGSGIDFEGIAGWVPMDIDLGSLKNWLANKMLNPRAIPVTTQELILEHCLTRYAVSQALKEHHRLAVELKGVQTKRSISDVFDQIRSGRTRVDMTRVDVLIGTGGPLTRAPHHAQSLTAMLDGVQPEGITEVYLDAQNVLPALGLLEDLEEGKGLDLLEDSLEPLATVVSPSFPREKEGMILQGTLKMPDGTSRELSIRSGSIEILPVRPNETCEAHFRPARGVNLGAGPGKPLRVTLEGAKFGVILDARGRPLEGAYKKHAVEEMLKALAAYATRPDTNLSDWGLRPVPERSVLA